MTAVNGLNVTLFLIANVLVGFVKLEEPYNYLPTFSVQREVVYGTCCCLDGDILRRQRWSVQRVFRAVTNGQVKRNLRQIAFGDWNHLSVCHSVLDVPAKVGHHRHKSNQISEIRLRPHGPVRLIGQCTVQQHLVGTLQIYDLVSLQKEPSLCRERVVIK